MPTFQPDSIVVLLAMGSHMGVSCQQCSQCQALYLWISVDQGSIKASKTDQAILLLA